MGADSEVRVAVLIPCHNEEKTVAGVVSDFRGVLPEAKICVFDNASTDKTSEVARASGAHVFHVPRKGKGNVVAAMFANVEADVYVMVDGDATYDASAAPEAVKRLIEKRLDLVNIARRYVASDISRPGHRWGNRVFHHIVRRFFGQPPGDMLSGFKVFSRRFVKTFASFSTGFEIETEILIHTLELGLPWEEISAPYYARPEGSESKLNTFKDGGRIFKFILGLYKLEHPLGFFVAIGAGFAVTSLGLGIPLVAEYLQTGLVPRFPTAFLAASLMIIAAIFGTIGLILDTVTSGRREFKRLIYLQYPSPGTSGKVAMDGQEGG
ncbi:MAG: glycosyltransferase family 2 protein [Methylohalobius crimeensis]